MSTEKEKAYQRELYKSVKERGLCVNCHRNKAIRGQTRCPECAERDRETSKISREKHIEEKRAKDRERYADRKAKGDCVNCGKRPAVTGKTQCEKCAAKNRARLRKRYAETHFTRDKRIYSGICVMCDQPAMDGWDVCAKHKAELMERSYKGGKASSERRKADRQTDERTGRSFGKYKRRISYH